jgi:hypothetical protein
MKLIETVTVLLLLMPLGSFPHSQHSRGSHESPYSGYHDSRYAPDLLTELLLPVSSGSLFDTGIKEIVPHSLRPKYERWRSELLATKVGRELWNLYDNNPRFSLKIVVAGNKQSGAGTGDFKWNEEGELIGATVFLGTDLDRGFPDPVYYPVMNSLETAIEAASIKGNLLASTKMAHELGHVKFTSQINGKVFQRQNKLIANYYSIFLKNGHKTSDPRLVAMVDELGARPIEIWEDREYWSEVVALGYVVERMNSDPAICALLRKIKTNLNNFAAGYKERFEDFYGVDSLRSCGK